MYFPIVKLKNNNTGCKSSIYLYKNAKYIIYIEILSKNIFNKYDNCKYNKYNICDILLYMIYIYIYLQNLILPTFQLSKYHLSKMWYCFFDLNIPGKFRILQ